MRSYRGPTGRWYQAPPRHPTGVLRDGVLPTTLRLDPECIKRLDVTLQTPR